MQDIRSCGPDEPIMTSEEFRDAVIRRLLDGDVVLNMMFVQLTHLQTFYEAAREASNIMVLASSVGLGHLAPVALKTIAEVGQRTAREMMDLSVNGLTPYELATNEEGVRASEAYKKLKEEVCSTD